MRFGLSLRFGLRREHWRCQIVSDSGLAMRTANNNKGVVAKRVFAEARRFLTIFLSHRCWCIILKFFVCILFAFSVSLSTPPLCSQFLPQNPLSLGPTLLFLVEEREPAGAGFGGVVWTGSFHSKRKNFLSKWREKR